MRTPVAWMFRRALSGNTPKYTRFGVPELSFHRPQEPDRSLAEVIPLFPDSFVTVYAHPRGDFQADIVGDGWDIHGVGVTRAEALLRAAQYWYTHQETMK